MSDGPYRSRYAAMAAMSDEDRAAARALSTASFEKTFPPLLVEFAGGALQYSPHGPLTDPIEQITRSPHECPAWVRRREKARREIAEHKAHIDWQDVVSKAHQAIPSDGVADLKAFCEGLFE